MSTFSEHYLVFAIFKPRPISYRSYEHTLQIPDSNYEKKNTQNEHIIAHFEHFFTYHYSKTVWLAENLIEIELTHYEKIFLKPSKDFLI